MESQKPPLWVRWLAAVASARPVVAVLRNSISGIDRWLLGRTGGRVALSGVLPTLLLTTTGRKSGEPRSAPLLYLDHDEGYAVIGTNFGGTRHPAWYLNLQSDPAAEVMVGGERIAVTAREAQSPEWEELWSRAVKMYPGYDTYITRVGDRQVPIVVLSRANSSAARA